MHLPQLVRYRGQHRRLPFPAAPSLSPDLSRLALQLVMPSASYCPTHAAW